MSGQIVPNQNESEWWKWQVGNISQPGRPVRWRRWLDSVVAHVGEFSQELEQFALYPGVQHSIRRVGHSFGTHLAGRWTEQGQQLGCAATDVLVRLAPRASLRLPGLASLGHGLIRASLILTPQRDAHRFGHAIGQFDQPLFTSVFGSVTVTTPALRLRCAVPVGHQVRVRWYELPASSSTRRMVLVPTCDKPARRKLRCKVVSDQVARSITATVRLTLGGGDDAGSLAGRIRRSPTPTAGDP